MSQLEKYLKRLRLKIVNIVEIEENLSSGRYEFDATCQIPNLSMIYERFFPNESGTFVEIGGFDGVTFSNTYGLAKAGWRGLLAEPEPSHFALCVSNLSKFRNCKVVKTAISDVDKVAVLHRQGPLSTLSDSHHNAYKNMRWADGEESHGEMDVHCLTLDSFLEQNSINEKFELLVIDVEGHEREVLEGFNLHRWSPQMIIIELADLHPDFPELEDTCIKLRKLIEESSYKIIYKDAINTIFVKSESLENRLLARS